MLAGIRDGHAGVALMSRDNPLCVNASTTKHSPRGSISTVPWEESEYRKDVVRVSEFGSVDAIAFMTATNMPFWR